MLGPTIFEWAAGMVVEGIGGIAGTRVVVAGAGGAGA